MPKRLAIVIAGAVSLGSYEAGVLYEILQALKAHNTAPATTEDEKVYIDVITGASAGGMTAAMAAQRLLYDADSLDGDESNVFYKAWVADISLWGLVRMGWREKISHSLFSSNCVKRIGERLLVESTEKQDPAKPPKPHPAIDISRPLRLGLALTNLNGMDYGFNLINAQGKFQYTRSVDQMTFKLSSDNMRDIKLWQRITDGAVASGAFPFAFRVCGIERERKEFDRTNVEWKPEWRDKHTFTYTDGGTLQNQPIGMAKNLIDDMVTTRVGAGDSEAYSDADSRVYLFVSPHALKSETYDKISTETGTLGLVADAVGRAIYRQALFHDWIMAEDANRRVDSLDVAANGLAQILLTNQINAKAVATASSALAQNLVPDAASRGQAIQRLKIQYRDLYAQLGGANQSDESEAFVYSIFVLERAGHLQDRDRMDVLAVMPKPGEFLAGAGLAAFAGFFSRKYRDYDYTFGRNKARDYLQKDEVTNLLGNLEGLSKEPIPDNTGIKQGDLPISIWRALPVGFPALSFMALWRVIRSLPWLLGLGAMIALVIFLLRHLCWR